MPRKVITLAIPKELKTGGQCVSKRDMYLTIKDSHMKTTTNRKQRIENVLLTSDQYQYV